GEKEPLYLFQQLKICRVENHSALCELERSAVKVARSVLRGLPFSNEGWLLDLMHYSDLM
ncbi:hypothetical protein, partial [Legionella santicrucis]|uniref:hypothetical protein n=1 Tax=Legionella santicrucis TaxID=45074 RepID=UPI001A9556E1